MKTQDITKSAITERMYSSRVQLGGLLDADHNGVTLVTLQRTARIVELKLQLDLV